MLLLKSEISKQDQVLEKYYYYIFSDYFKRLKNRIFLIIFFPFFIFSAGYFYFQGISPFVSLVFVPFGVPVYFMVPMLAWKYSIDALWKKTYKAYGRELYVERSYLSIKSYRDDFKGEVVNVDGMDVYRIFFNKKNLVLFFSNRVALFSLDSGCDLDVIVGKMRNLCPNAEVKNVKEKTNLI